MIMWKVLYRFEDPAKVVQLIEVLHVKVNMEFTVSGVTSILHCTIGLRNVTYLDQLYSLCTLPQS